MLEALDHLISLRQAIWVFAVASLLHDAEEVLTAERFLRENRSRLPLPPVLARQADTSTAQFAAAIALICALAWPLTYLTARSPKKGFAVDLFMILVAGRFLNVFTHIGQMLLLRRYTPGVLSAVTVVLPYSAYTLHRLRVEGLMGRGDLARAMTWGAVLAGPLVVVGHVFGRLATRRLHRLISIG